jgi:hypothetical protein
MENVNEVQQQVERMLAAELVLTKAKEDFAEEKEKLRRLIGEHLVSLPKSDARKWASELYWQRPELGGIVRKAHKSPGKFKPLPVQIRITCIDCQQPAQILAHHWGAADSLWGMCERCEERRKLKDEQRRFSIQAYQRRMTDRLNRLKSMPYAEYLRTPEWKQTSETMLERASWRCQICNQDKSLQVHHRTYERRGCEAAEDLIVLCRDCHSRFHDKLPASDSVGSQSALPFR